MVGKTVPWPDPYDIDGLVQDCSIFIANVLEMLQSSTDIILSTSC